MRVLGLDYGSARCGCALSDPSGTLVTPTDVVTQPATRRGMDALAALVEQREVQRVVVGLPLSLGGEDTEQTREARRFAHRLERRLGQGVQVELHDERFTTRMAQRLAHGSAQGATAAAPEDSRAAALMLEDWLAAHQRAGDHPPPQQGEGGRPQRPGDHPRREGNHPAASNL
jgi:putative Holliday junction resolvase